MRKTEKLPSKTRLERWLIHRFSLRVHMFLILLCTASSGVLFNFFLHHMGRETILGRYPLAVILSYGVFLVLIKIWLRFIFPHHRSSSFRPISSSWFPVWSDRSGNVSGPPDPERFRSGGGRSGGGGASGSWGTAALANSSVANAATPAEFDMKDGGKAGESLAVLIAGSLLIVGIIGGAFYVIWASPAILSEAAFQFGLATGVIRSSRKAIIETGWIGGVFRSTWIPLAIVLFLATSFGWIVHENCPDRTTASEVFQSCLSRY